MIRDIKVIIEGQVEGEGNSYEVVVAKLGVICAEYGLELTEVFE